MLERDGSLQTVLCVMYWNGIISYSDFHEYSWGSGDICSVIHHRI